MNTLQQLKDKGAQYVRRQVWSPDRVLDIQSQRGIVLTPQDLFAQDWETAEPSLLITKKELIGVIQNSFRDATNENLGELKESTLLRIILQRLGLPW